MAKENAETSMERLVAIVEMMSHSLNELTAEMRQTNENVQKLHLNHALIEQTVDAHQREIYTGDNSSRIRTLELNVKGLFAVTGFIALTLGGQLLAILSHWSQVFGGVKP